MCYRCQVCGKTVQGGMRRHIVYRSIPAPIRSKQRWENSRGRVITEDYQTGGGKRQEIAREIAVCPDCQHYLNTGETLEYLLRTGGQPKEVTNGNKVDEKKKRIHYDSLAERLGICDDETLGEADQL